MVQRFRLSSIENNLVADIQILFLAQAYLFHLWSRAQKSEYPTVIVNSCQGAKDHALQTQTLKSLLPLKA